jgi:AAA+ superfamily predicted ATPase
MSTVTAVNNLTGTIIPSQYKYRLRCYTLRDVSLLSLLPLHYNSPTGNISHPNGNIYPQDGEHEILGVNVFVKETDEKNDGILNLYFINREECEKLYKIVEELDEKMILAEERKMYTCRSNRWVQTHKYNRFDVENYVGYSRYVDRIMNEIKSLSDHSAFLASKGECNKSLNYLLFGMPGTGKTSLVKIIASKLNCSIYYVKAQDALTSDISTILDPLSVENGRYDAWGDIAPKTKIIKKTNPVSVVLLEDFDRIIDGKKFSLSDILNTLDGVQSTHSYIRFFTGNICQGIFDNAALTSRFNGILRFDTPDKEMLRVKLYQFLSFYAGTEAEVESKLDMKKINTFLNLVEKIQNRNSNISIRSFANYIKLYLFNRDTYLDDLIANINELEEMTKLLPPVETKGDNINDMFT